VQVVFEVLNIGSTSGPTIPLLFIRLLTVDTHFHPFLIQRVLLSEIENIKFDLTWLVDFHLEKEPLGKSPSINVVINQKVILILLEATYPTQVA
jgi:hypothetical protein